MLKTKSGMNLFNCSLRSLERSSGTAVLLRRISGAPAPAVAVLRYHRVNKSMCAWRYDRYLG
jgi:hypothetical protein